MSRPENLFLAALLMTLPLLPAPARAQDPAEDAAEAEAEAPAESPLEMAYNYTALLMEGEAGLALDRYWDLEAVVKSAFGANLAQHSAEEVVEIERLLRDHLQRHNGSPRNLHVLRRSKFESFKVRERSGTPKTAMITYTLLIDKTERVLMTLIVRESGNSWRIIDGGVMGRMMAAQLRNEYRKAREMKPLEFTRAMIKAVNARAAEASIGLE